MQDNGVKLVDPSGEMLDQSWEAHATALANCPSTSSLLSTFVALATHLRVDLAAPASLVYARDTRPSGPELVAALEAGLSAFKNDVKVVDLDVTTTPVLHYVIKATNDKSRKFGVPTVQGYMEKMAKAFKTLVVRSILRCRARELTRDQGSRGPLAPLYVDCANGVGAMAVEEMTKHIGHVIALKPLNNHLTTPGALNSQCGADYVKTKQALPPSIASGGFLSERDTRGCSFDGDADRIVYYYLQEGRSFRLLDGDKIAVMVAMFLGDLVKKAKLTEGEDPIKVGVVQTAYANGSSTKYLTSASHQDGVSVAKC